VGILNGILAPGVSIAVKKVNIEVSFLKDLDIFR
jgi:hypothetical protein